MTKQSSLFDRIPSLRPVARGIITATVAVVLGVLGTQYAIVAVIAPNLQATADRASCRTLYSGAAPADVIAVDPFCAKKLGIEANA